MVKNNKRDTKTTSGNNGGGAIVALAAVAAIGAAGVWLFGKINAKTEEKVESEEKVVSD